MGGKSGAPSPPNVVGPYDAQYSAMYPDVAGYERGPFAHFQDYGSAEGRQYGPPPVEMPDFGAMFEGMASQRADYEAQLRAQQEAQARMAGESERDAVYGEYMNAAETATDYITNQIAQQRSNAALLGTQYTMNDEMKGTMISDYFASIWGAGDQARLEGLMKQWGKPKGFSEFAVVRGDGSKYSEGTEGSQTTEAVSEGKRTLAGGGVPEEDETLSKLSILGG
jgi:hypothetical protein